MPWHPGHSQNFLFTDFKTTLPPQISNVGPIKVLLADDDGVLANLLQDYLESEGLSVSLAEDGEAAIRKLESGEFDILVLDVMMPGLSGIEVLKRVRVKKSLPVIMLTARGDDLDRILGLELGADDYLTKPCNPRELLARIHAVLRRITVQGDDPNLVLEVGDISIDPSNRAVTIDRDESPVTSVSLTQTEFDLLHLLISTPNQLVKKSDISLKVLGKPLSQWDRSIDVHVSNLRKKLRLHGDGAERIKTLRGSGYLYKVGLDSK